MTSALAGLVWIAMLSAAAAPKPAEPSKAADLGSISPWATGVTEADTIRKWLVTEATALAAQGKTAEALAVVDRAEQFLERYTRQNDIPQWDPEVARLYQLAQSRRASLHKGKAGEAGGPVTPTTTSETKLTSEQMKTLAAVRKNLNSAAAAVEAGKSTEAKDQIQTVFKQLDTFVTDTKAPPWHKSISPVYSKAADLDEALNAAAGQTQKAGSAKGGPAVGDPAPPLVVPGLDGKAISSKDLAGKWVVLDFWATWCEPCRAAMPKLKELQEQYGKDSRFVLVSVSLDTKVGDAKSYVAKNGLTWTHGIVAQGWRAPLVKKYAISGIPTILLISPEGRIVSRAHAPPTAAAVAKALAQPPAAARPSK